MMRWVRRIILVLAATFASTYGGDWAVYTLRGAPQSKVTVSRTLTIPLKGNKQEIDSLGTQEVPCSLSIFSQSGLTACWQLRRHINQNTIL